MFLLSLEKGWVHFVHVNKNRCSGHVVHARVHVFSSVSRALAISKYGQIGTRILVQVLNRESNPIHGVQHTLNAYFFFFGNP